MSCYNREFFLLNVTLSTFPNSLENINWSELGKNLKAKKVSYLVQNKSSLIIVVIIMTMTMMVMLMRIFTINAS